MGRQLWIGLAAVGAVWAVGTKALALDPALIDKAVQKGVEVIKRAQRENGSWRGGYASGIASLAGLTLLECGVPSDDSSVKKAADFVRNDSLTMTDTYHLALGILFLDRLSDPADVPLIESMTVRLLAGQNANGGWSYQCPSISAEEVRRLTTVLKGRSELVAGQRPKGGSTEHVQEIKRSSKDLPREIQDQLEAIARGNFNPPPPPAGFPGVVADRTAFGGDNSNTQFAILALWVARRYGLPVEDAVARTDARFRKSQHRDGGWGYRVEDPESTNTMTCAGTLALAVAHGIAADLAKKANKPAPDPSKDAPLQAALLAISTTIDHPVEKRGGRVEVIPQGRRAYYFLWSLERVAMALGLETIGKKDWYTWGAEILVANQRADGSWLGDHAWLADNTVDTCFALLFLRRANLARDLTARFRNRLSDPGQRVLQAGGVGGKALKGGGGIKPPSETSSRPETATGRKDPPRQAAQPENESSRLAKGLIEATASDRERVLSELRDGKGSVYTEALASAIPQLNADAKRKAREALADRLTRMKAETLANYLQDEDAEIRRAAALAVAVKDVRTLTPRLIELLGDSEPLVGRAAHAALKAMTGKDFGPTANADRAEVSKAITAWKDWWSKEGGK
jgi:hypothetical protein